MATNPITTVGGATVPCPTKYEWTLQDVSAPDAGRTEDGAMQKMRIGQAVRIDLEWKHVSLANAAAILSAFNPEYFTVVCLSCLTGTFASVEYYCGDRKGVLWDSTNGYWESISFPIIARYLS